MGSFTAIAKCVCGEKLVGYASVYGVSPYEHVNAGCPAAQPIPPVTIVDGIIPKEEIPNIILKK